MKTIRHRDRLFTYLDGTGHLPSEVGGKATGLDRLIGQQYPVPHAAAITTATYRTVVAEPSLQLLISDLRTSGLPQPHRIAAESAAIERSFLTVPLPPDVSATIARVADEMLRQGPVAIRSSATAEDLNQASFAGQYLTVTGVAGVTELEAAVRRCWASLWMPAARAYRRRHRIPDHDIAMAIVIQTMVTPDWAGVAFTVDPQGQSHLMRIEAVPGLGDALVSGKVTPADYLVRRDTLEVAPTDGSSPLAFLEDLARLALRIEQSEGGPQDIEWAFTAAGIELLQVRPITDIDATAIRDDGLNTTPHDAATYTPHGVIEMLPGVIPPLLWTINSPMLEDAFRTTFAELGGVTPSKSRPLVGRFRGRAALDLSAICEIAGTLPGGNPAEVERQYLGRSLSAVTARKRRVNIGAAMRGRRVHNLIIDEVELISTTAEALARMGINLNELPVRRLVAYRQRIRDLAWRGYAAEVGASGAAGATYRALEVLLERWLPDHHAASWAQRITRGALGASAIGAARSRQLAAILEHYGTPEIRKVIASTDTEPRSEIGSLGPPGRRFLSVLDTAVRIMGSTSLYGGPTWSEDETWIWRQLEYLVDETRRGPKSTDSHTDDFGELCHSLAANKRWKRIRILTGQFIDLRVRWLRRQLDETLRFLEQRERAKNALLVLGGEERRIIVEASRRLVESRQLADADLAQYLTDDELESMLFGNCGMAGAELSRRRNLAMAYAVQDPLPDWFAGDPDSSPSAVTPASDRLEGWAAGPGCASGRVRIISSLAEGIRLERGDVLVAHSTDPSWTPLFLQAGAIVLETGGPLSHAAIVAREFGLPAVLNIPQATRVLHDGELVLVDGTLGLVERSSAGSRE